MKDPIMDIVMPVLGIVWLIVFGLDFYAHPETLGRMVRKLNHAVPDYELGPAVGFVLRDGTTVWYHNRKAI
jgi:hypothetical protein